MCYFCLVFQKSRAKPWLTYNNFSWSEFSDLIRMKLSNAITNKHSKIVQDKGLNFISWGSRKVRGETESRQKSYRQHPLCWVSGQWWAGPHSSKTSLPNLPGSAWWVGTFLALLLLARKPLWATRLVPFMLIFKPKDTSVSMCQTQSRHSKMQRV